MNILSIDIGIKNLAYCVLRITNNNEKSFEIIQWGVINLCGETPECCYMIKGKTKKDTSLTKCNKKASLSRDGKHYCKTHAKKTEYILPCRENNIKKNIKLDDLIKIATKYNIKCPNPIRKASMLDSVVSYMNNNMLTSLAKLSANNLSLIDIGIAIKKYLPTHIQLNDIDKVIIENQLSPLASRMKTIQGMVAQFFIMENIFDISFISACNKLKPFTKDKLNYSQRKLFSIDITRKLLNTSSDNQHGNTTKWLSVFNKHSKKDDLADCLLQGLWYSYDKNLLSFNNLD